MLRSFYDRVILARPRAVLFVIIAAVAFFGYQSRNVIIDASSETLLLEDDQDLKYTREVYARYGVHDFLVVTFTPSGDLLSESSLSAVEGLKAGLAHIDGVDSVTTILDVPLLESPPKPIRELIKDVPTLEKGGVEIRLAREELVNSPIYRNLVVSPDFKTTALQVNLPVDETYAGLLKRRDDLKAEKRFGENKWDKEKELEIAEAAFKAHRGTVRDKQHRLIQDVRDVIDRHRGAGDLFLGGVSMIADDLVTFVKNDLRVFGIGVFVFLVLTLLIIFRQLRWILLPLVCVLFSTLVMGGILGLTGWEVTVISSNFISLQLIMTMAFTVHLTVRYRELLAKDPGADQRNLVLSTVLLMAQPCLYSALTTLAGFGSLVFSGILPVINFGWMMGAGISISLLMTFLIFPAVVVLLNKRPPNVFFEEHFPLTKVFARFTEKRGAVILTVSLSLLILSVIGVSRLVVENSFISYFKETTEIHQGLRLIDQQLGGTTPLDITIDLGSRPSDPSPVEGPGADSSREALQETQEDEFDDFSDFEEEFAKAEGEA
ncbi:MAG TPA: MMPL family transporter, partial [Nitrospiria bacterium]